MNNLSKNMMKKTFILAFLITLLLTLIPAMPVRAGVISKIGMQNIIDYFTPAVEMAGFETVDQQWGLQIALGTLIRFVLAIMGSLFLTLTLYGGYTWMTAGGNEEKVTKARKVLANAIIGLVIVIAAYSITSSLIRQLIDVSEGVEFRGWD